MNPYHVKQSKEFDDNNPTKSDRKDPKVIAGLVNAGRYSYSYIPKDIYAEESARIEIADLLDDIERYAKRVNDLIELLDQKLTEIPYVDKLMAIPGIGKRTVCGFIAEVGDIRRFDSPKQLQKLAELNPEIRRKLKKYNEANFEKNEGGRLSLHGSFEARGEKESAEAGSCLCKGAAVLKFTQI